jgi:hypothetical protein
MATEATGKADGPKRAACDHRRIDSGGGAGIQADIKTVRR